MNKTITLAESAGFCFGVNRAIELVNSLLDEGKKVCTLGPIIHNEQVVKKLGDRGVVIAETPDDVPPDHVLVIRSHGVPLPIYEELARRQLEIQDATCPFVSKIHSIVTKASEKGDIILIAGNSEHPEVLGIKSRCANVAYTFRDDVELSELLKKHPEIKEKSVSVVAQTTFNTEIWKKCLEIFKKDCTNATLFDTICNATQSRQQEAAELSEKCDLMIVIGGTNSSNTAKLFHICSAHCRSVLIQTADDLPVEEVTSANHIGVTAGASTPADIIKDVLSALNNLRDSSGSNGGTQDSCYNLRFDVG